MEHKSDNQSQDNIIFHDLFLCLKWDFFSATGSVVALVGSLAIVAASMRGSSGT